MKNITLKQYLDVHKSADKTAMVLEYCKECGYCISHSDMELITDMGLKESFEKWKLSYVKYLWDEFGAIPMDPETEELEESWHDFPKRTHREEIWHWFEETFNISVGTDLMGL